MATHLRELLAPHRAALITAVFDGLRGSTAPHYQVIDPTLLNQRALRLVDAFLAANGAPPPFIGYIQQLSLERICEGYYLNEIQTALNLLDAEAWELVAESAAPTEVVRLLGHVCRTVGAAKDELARIYLARAQDCEERAGHLERRLEDLFKGTEGPVAPEE
jgi:hypothetical protein